VIGPSLPGCITYGDTIEEAIEMAKEAIELYIESLKEHGEEIPTEEGTLEYTLTVGLMPKLLSLTPQKIIKMLEKKGKVRALLHSPKFYMVATLKK